MAKATAIPECPVARSLIEVGERWSLLILRDAFTGLTRFEDFRRSLGCPTNILTTRLAGLTRDGLLTRRLYSERPPRHDYVLTEKGRDLFPTIATLLAWGNRWLAPEGAALVLKDEETAEVIDPVLIDGRTGRPVRATTTTLAPGPAAGPQINSRIGAVGLP